MTDTVERTQRSDIVLVLRVNPTLSIGGDVTCDDPHLDRAGSAERRIVQGARGGRERSDG